MTPSLLHNISIMHEGDNKKFDTKKQKQNQKKTFLGLVYTQSKLIILTKKVLG